MKVAALIPARKHSRRLLDKNWRKVGDKPLWVHAVDHARNSGACHAIALSTDDPPVHLSAVDLSGTQHRFRIEQPQFSQTYNVMLEVVRHADGALLDLNYDAEAICLLQPTSPLRTAKDVAACVDILGGGAWDAVVSVTDAEDDIVFNRRHAGRLERVPPERVRPNGAIYVIRTKVLREGGSWYGDFTHGYVMPKERSIDIDNEVDLEMARAAWGKLNGPGG